MEEIKKKAREMLYEEFFAREDGKKPQLHEKSLWNVKLVSLVEKIIDLAVSKEQERVTSKTDEVWDLLCQMDTNIKSEKEYAKDIINLINTK